MTVATDKKSQIDWLGRYRELCRMMYEIRRRLPSLTVLGMSCVHARHSIPPSQLDFLRDWTGESRVRPSGIFRYLSRWLVCVIYAVRDTLSLAVIKLRFCSAFRRMKQETATVILKTWSPSNAFLKQEKDFYYGTLPRALEERGISVLRLVGNGRSKINPAFARASLESDHIRTIPEYLLVPLWAPFVHVLRQCIVVIALIRLSHRVRNRRLADYCTLAAYGCLEPYNMRYIFMFYIARAAVRIWGPKALVTLYEGQPWEMLAWRGTKDADPSCVTVGYQHTVLMPHSLAVLSPNTDPDEISTPDVVLTLGEITRDWMVPGHRSLGTRIVPFGSYRRWAQSYDAWSEPEPARRTILVLPEGILSEARLLFDFAMKVAERMPDHQFLFRCHPEQPIKKVLPHLERRLEEVRNVSVSRKRVIEDDFVRSSVVLYRGSSAMLYAVLGGLKPIYLSSARLPDTDPLIELSEWRETASNPGEMETVLRAFERTDRSTFLREWQGACQYVDRYTRPVDAGSIEHFLSAVGLDNGGKRS